MRGPPYRVGIKSFNASAVSARVTGLADMPAIDAMKAVLRNWRRDRSNLFIVVSLKLCGLPKIAR